MMTDLEQLPSISAVYRVLHQGTVVYVGQAKNLKHRWKSHHLLFKLFRKYGQDWTIEWVEVSPDNLNRAEAFAYRFFKPELNQKNPNFLIGESPEEVDHLTYNF